MIKALDTNEIISHLETLNYLEHCGEPPDHEWGVPKVRDMQSAIFAYGTDFGAFQIPFINQMGAWVKEHMDPDPDEYIYQQREFIYDRVDAIVRRRIWPLMPKHFRRGGSNFRFQVETGFRMDFMHLAIERALGEYGLPPGLFSMLLAPYEAGRYPCGWEGEYPEGRLIVY